MTRFRLNRRHRDTLVELIVEEAVKNLPSVKALAAAETELYKHLRRLLREAYPQDEMKILRKHFCAWCWNKSNTINLTRQQRNTPHYFGYWFTIHNDGEDIWIPQNHNSPALIITDLSALVIQHNVELLREQVQSEKRELRAKTFSLVVAFRFFEDLVDVLPEAEKYRGYVDSRKTKANNLPMSRSTVDLLQSLLNKNTTDEEQ